MAETNTSKTSLHYKSQEPDQEGQYRQGPGGHLIGWGTGLQRRKSGHTQGETLDYRSPGDKSVPYGTEAAIILVLTVIIYFLYLCLMKKGKICRDVTTLNISLFQITVALRCTLPFRQLHWRMRIVIRVDTLQQSLKLVV